MTAPPSSSNSRVSARKSTKSDSKRRSRKVRFWFSSSSKHDDDDDLAADAAAAVREVDAEAMKNQSVSPQSSEEEQDVPWASDEQVNAHYAAIGWTVAAICKDGNCLFRAVSDQLYASELFHRDIRQRLVDFIEREQQLFRPFVDDEEVSEYCTRMREDGEWGGHPELYAAAKLFNIHIVVHTGPMHRLVLKNDANVDAANVDAANVDAANVDAANVDAANQMPPSPPPYRTLHLLFKDDHYSSLHPNEAERHQVRADVAAENADKRARSPTRVVASPQKKKLKDVKALACEQEELPQCGVRLPRQVIFRRGKRRVSGATLFSLVHVPSTNNLAALPESQSASESESSGSEGESPTEAEPPVRTKPTSPTVRVVPVVFPSKTTFHKGRPVAASC
ncbi:hypothetical protein BBJ28_00001479 [Nothophytophthora sp. Chile5]|nr:hypothetical protein BBJ28_00001479 [Nothophytophthora sp. Chile5]